MSRHCCRGRRERINRQREVVVPVSGGRGLDRVDARLENAPDKRPIRIIVIALDVRLQHLPRCARTLQHEQVLIARSVRPVQADTQLHRLTQIEREIARKMTRRPILRRVHRTTHIAPTPTTITRHNLRPNHNPPRLNTTNRHCCRGRRERINRQREVVVPVSGGRGLDRVDARLENAPDKRPIRIIVIALDVRLQHLPRCARTLQHEQILIGTYSRPVQTDTQLHRLTQIEREIARKMTRRPILRRVHRTTHIAPTPTTITRHNLRPNHNPPRLNTTNRHCCRGRRERINRQREVVLPVSGGRGLDRVDARLENAPDKRPIRIIIIALDVRLQHLPRCARTLQHEQILIGTYSRPVQTDTQLHRLTQREREIARKMTRRPILRRVHRTTHIAPTPTTITRHNLRPNHNPPRLNTTNRHCCRGRRERINRQREVVLPVSGGRGLDRVDARLENAPDKRPIRIIVIALDVRLQHLPRCARTLQHEQILIGTYSRPVQTDTQLHRLTQRERVVARKMTRRPILRRVHRTTHIAPTPTTITRHNLRPNHNPPRLNTTNRHCCRGRRERINRQREVVLPVSGGRGLDRVDARLENAPDKRPIRIIIIALDVRLQHLPRCARTLQHEQILIGTYSRPVQTDTQLHRLTQREREIARKMTRRPILRRVHRTTHIAPTPTTITRHNLRPNHNPPRLNTTNRHCCRGRRERINRQREVVLPVSGGRGLDRVDARLENAPDKRPIRIIIIALDVRLQHLPRCARTLQHEQILIGTYSRPVQTDTQLHRLTQREREIARKMTRRPILRRVHRTTHIAPTPTTITRHNLRPNHNPPRLNTTNRHNYDQRNLRHASGHVRRGDGHRRQPRRQRRQRHHRPHNRHAHHTLVTRRNLIQINHTTKTTRHIESHWVWWRLGLLVSNQCVVGLSGTVGLLELHRRYVTEV